jgi:hypothetical protein
MRGHEVGENCIMRAFMTCMYSSPSIIRMIKSRRMRWAGYVARMGSRGMHVGYWWKSQKQRDQWEDQEVGGSIILEWILVRM